MQDWGRILVATRLEKQVSARFFQTWNALVLRGLRPGDGSYSVAGKVAHKALNDIVRHLLATECDTLLTLDSDADVAQEFVEQFRSYEPGFAYDILQAFYPRRGWPPRAIWLKRDALGQMMEHHITDPDLVEEVDICGTHACLFRRTVFERMLGDNDPAGFEWFFYPRHQPDSEDGAFSLEAKAAGFRLGATAAVTAGHLSEVNITWESYQDYLRITGRAALVERFRDLTLAVADFTGESVDLVAAKASRGGVNVKEAWHNQISFTDSATAVEERAFYGSPSNGYLYDLINWNCSALYERILQPLRLLSRQRVLVIGCGLGTEADAMAEHNQVDAFELPGALRDFAMWRLGTWVNWLYGETLASALDADEEYDLIVAIDTLEHVHPDELPDLLTALGGVLAPRGALYCHNNWGQQELYPMHHDHSALFAYWTEQAGLVQKGEFLWERN